MSLNRERIWLGGFVGGVVWIIWSVIINMVVIGRARYEAMQAAGRFLKEGRYPAFEVQWILMLFVLAILLAHLYAWVRPVLGPGPKTALKIGALVGFASGSNQLRYRHLGGHPAHVSPGLDAGAVGGLDSGDAGRGLVI